MINFIRIDESCVVADDSLYHIHKNDLGSWDVWCQTNVVAYHLTLGQAKQVIRAINVVRFANVNMSKCL